jgi:hypothetical protein
MRRADAVAHLTISARRSDVGEIVVTFASAQGETHMTMAEALGWAADLAPEDVVGLAINAVVREVAELEQPDARVTVPAPRE